MTVQTYAVIVGLVAMLVGPPFLVAPKEAAAWYKKLMNDDILIRMLGAMFLALSVLVLMQDPTIGGTPYGLVKLLAWIGVFKSLTVCWWTGWYREVGGMWFSFSWGPSFVGGVMTVFGAWLLWIVPTL